MPGTVLGIEDTAEDRADMVPIGLELINFTTDLYEVRVLRGPRDHLTHSSSKGGL